MEYIRLVKAINRAKREGRTEELLQTLKKNNEIQQTMLRPMQYETINRAGEIGWGMSILCLALASYISSGGSWMWQWRTGISCLLMLCAICAMPFCHWAIKKYATQPRTGYVAYRRDGKFWIMMVVTLVVAVGVSIGLSRLMRPEIIQLAQSQAHQSGATVPGTLSHGSKIMLAILVVSNPILYLMINAVSIKEHRWKWLLLVLIALGPLGICLLVPGNFIALSRPVMLFLGLVWLFSGAVTLFTFLRHHQPLAPEAG